MLVDVSHAHHPRTSKEEWECTQCNKSGLQPNKFAEYVLHVNFSENR